jgi:hypothetical protein
MVMSDAKKAQVLKDHAFAPQAGEQLGKRTGPSYIDEQSLAILLDHVVVAGEIADVDDVHRMTPGHRKDLIMEIARKCCSISGCGLFG